MTFPQAASVGPQSDEGNGLGSALHARMIEIAHGDRVGSERWSRPLRLDRLRRLKIRFALRQRHFASRLVNLGRHLRNSGRVASVDSLPPTIGIETGRFCALQCPGCEVGLDNAAPGRLVRGEYASLDTMKTIIDATYRKVFQVQLKFHGEPLLNRNLFAASDYAVEKGLWTVIHTNLNPKIPDLATKILDSRLCNVVASIDGATQDVYEQYRRNGDAEVAFGHMRELADAKTRRGSELPWITAKFLVFEHNWHEIDAFREKALEAGADDVLFVSGFDDGIYNTGRSASEVEFDLDTLQWSRRTLPDVCPFLWDDLRFDWDGSLYPCGYVNHPDHVFSRMPQKFSEADLTNAFNARPFQRMRNFFLDGRASGQPDPTDLPKPCESCEFVHRFVEKRRSSREADANDGKGT